jgi:hypothetical protein
LTCCEPSTDLPSWSVVEYRLHGRRTVHAERAVEGNVVIAV